ncbi:MAG: glycosyltransferase [Pseudomonadota bacterium]
MPSPSVSIIIPVHNGGPSFVRCLTAVLQNRPPPEEIIVAANGCRDRSIAAARLAGAAIVDFPAAIGPAAARNAAARRAAGDILFFVDADVALHPDALEKVRNCFGKDPDLAACFGSYDDRPPEKNFFSQYKNLFHHFTHQHARTDAATFWAGCGAVRRKVFLTVGGFDEAYVRPCIEDIELGYRLRAGGFRIRLEKTLLATHLKHWTLASILRADIFDRALPWARLIFQSRKLFDDLNTRKRYRYSVLLATLLAGLLPMGLLTGIALWPALCAAILLIVLNMDWYQFALQHKGWRWLIPAIAWHWVYYLYCGAAFAYAAIEHFLRGYQLLMRQDSKISRMNTEIRDSEDRRKTVAPQQVAKLKLPLRILRIRVIDWALLNNLAGALEIDRATAKHIDRLDHIVYSPARHKLSATRVRSNFTIYPTTSATKLHFFKDAYQLACRLHRQHRYHLIYADDPMWSGLVGYLLKRRFGLPLLIKCHSDYYSSPAWRRESPRYHLDYLFSIWMIRRADWLKAVSRRVATDLVCLGGNPERMTILTTPMMTGLFRPGAACPDRLCGNKILFVGRLERSKGLPLLLHAVARMKRAGVSASLTIAGEGSQRAHLEKLIRRLKLTAAVALIGFQAHRELPAVYRRHSLLVLPALYEAFGRVIVEAGLCGLPTVATRVGGIPELIADGRTGLLVRPGDVQALSAAIGMLLANPALAMRMGSLAEKRFRERFCFPDILAKQLKMLSTAAGQK